jgi:hypothetical protein
MLNPNRKLTIASFPYNYLIIEELFDEGTAFALQTLLDHHMTKGKTIGKVGEVGEHNYEALSYTPTFDDIVHSPISQIASSNLKDLISRLFRIGLDENIMIGTHRHMPPSKPGWTHTDFAIVSFPSIPANFQGQRIYDERGGCRYSDDSRDRQPGTIKTARAVACLYYTANPEWTPGMGGETGIYLQDGKTLVASIPPKNNSLFAFEISPMSYHAYQGSETMQRSSYIWWYHASPSMLVRRHDSVVAARNREGRDPWDRWTDVSVPKYEVL